MVLVLAWTRTCTYKHARAHITFICRLYFKQAYATINNNNLKLPSLVEDIQHASSPASAAERAQCRRRLREVARLHASPPQSTLMARARRVSAKDVVKSLLVSCSLAFKTHTDP